VLDDFEIRSARPDDAAGLADAWTEFGGNYVELDADEFRFPDPDGLVAWFEDRVSEEHDDDAAWFVAERDRRVIGFVEARIHRPSEDAGRQLLREMTETIVWTHSLMVLGDARRSGVATALMNAVEDWGKERGATRAVVIASLASAPAVAFYEDRMAYRRRTVGLSKPI
jgi:GNAT superfamily N-acetyltransferase